MKPKQIRQRSFILALGVVTFAFIAAPSVHAEKLANPSWRYTVKQPADGWQKVDFDDSSWETAAGGFGTSGTPGSRVGTTWNTSDIWLRKTFEINELPDRPGLLMHHDEDVKVYLNGQEVLSLTGWTQRYELTPLDAEFRTAVKPGKNTMAVHCKQTSGGQFIDVHFVDADNPASLPKLKPFASRLITEWGAKVTPENAWTQYPRPQMSRPDWTNLNGHWNYAITSIKQTEVPVSWHGKILVPFSLESRLGGVRELLSEDEALWYQRTFKARKSGAERTLLNFEAVDYRCQVFVNDKTVGKHQGGNTAFTFDITDALRDGENKLVVRVEDATEEWQLRGKQVRSPDGIMYTQVSGIWQTVWMEQVPTSHLSDLTIHTDAAAGTITIRPEIEGKKSVASVRVVVKDGAQQVAATNGDTEQISLTIDNPKLWSPSSPFLYDLEVSLLDSAGKVLDQVDSYAGIRSVGKARDETVTFA